VAKRMPLRSRYPAAFFWVSSSKAIIIPEIFSNYLGFVFNHLIIYYQINVD
jgi:hypothetical protein